MEAEALPLDVSKLMLYLKDKRPDVFVRLIRSGVKGMRHNTT